ncbi:hypothetical protein T10_7775 [Trichinella papuae]|uniref:Uncharacterized protein n=1 Tax=Trichinella papuae TaxID=268474 RepID=A0A0V1N1E7_9BILA|nr:hypothetical protein T10_7775 [Trichinella papuae]
MNFACKHFCSIIVSHASCSSSTFFEELLRKPDLIRFFLNNSHDLGSVILLCGVIKTNIYIYNVYVCTYYTKLGSTFADVKSKLTNKSNHITKQAQQQHSSKTERINGMGSESLVSFVSRPGGWMDGWMIKCLLPCANAQVKKKLDWSKMVESTTRTSDSLMITPIPENLFCILLFILDVIQRFAVARVMGKQLVTDSTSRSSHPKISEINNKPNNNNNNSNIYLCMKFGEEVAQSVAKAKTAKSESVKKASRNSSAVR